MPIPVVNALVLPWPPTVNTYWRRSAKGGKPRTHISNKGRAYRDDVIQLLLVSKAPRFGTARLAVHITAYPPDRRDRDLDNILKPLLDALEHGGVYANDSQIDDLHIVRGGVTTGGEVHIRITEIEERK